MSDKLSDLTRQPNSVIKVNIDKRITSYNSEINYSTSANLRSKNFSKSYTNASIPAMKSYDNTNIDKAKLLKREMFEDMTKAISPKSQSKLLLDLKGKSDNNITHKRKFPKLEDYKPRMMTASTFSEKTTILKKNLTLKKIEEERKYLKHFINTQVHSLDDNQISKNLKIPRSNKNIHSMYDFINTRKQTEKWKSEYEDTSYTRTDRIKAIESIINNPSLGKEYLKREYKFLPKELLYSTENRFERNYSSKCFGSVLFARRIRKEDDSDKYANVKNNKFTQVSKLKMKWKTIKWILENKKEVLDRLMDFHESILKITKKKDEEFDKGLTKRDFNKIMRSNGITTDENLINKLYWVFDEDGDNDLKYKEIAFGIEMFRESSLEKKLKSFFDLCDTDNSGAISKQEFLKLMKKNIISNDEKISIKQAVDKIFHSVKLNKDGEMTFEKLKEGCEKNREIQEIIDKNVLALHNIDHVIDKDIKNDISSFNPELNDQLRMKLLSSRTSYIPRQEQKFISVVNNFIKNKTKISEINHLLEIYDEDSFEMVPEETSLFEEEKQIIQMANNMKLNKN